jgi:predicted DNA-binding transcriptional regulator YafY
MMSVPAPLKQLGVGQELKQALLKLSAALPDSRRLEENRARQRIHLDSSWWFQSAEALPCLPEIQKALWQDRCLRLRLRQPSFNIEYEVDGQPYGLVAKAGVWYLVLGRLGSPRVLRVEDVIQADMLEISFTRPSGFDLEQFWEQWSAEYESQPPFVARLRLSPQGMKSLHYYVDERARRSLGELPPPDPEGWVTLDLPFDSLDAARARLLGLGSAVEVLAPTALRRSMIDFAEQIASVY